MLETCTSGASNRKSEADNQLKCEFEIERFQVPSWHKNHASIALTLRRSYLRMSESGRMELSYGQVMRISRADRPPESHDAQYLTPGPAYY